MANLVAWVIESGSKCLGTTEVEGGEFSWHGRHYDALRFATKGDAVRFIVALRRAMEVVPQRDVPYGWRMNDPLPAVHDHVWIGGISEEGVAGDTPATAPALEPDVKMDGSFTTRSEMMPPLESDFAEAPRDVATPTTEPDAWAVFSPGGVGPFGVFDNAPEAEAYAADLRLRRATSYLVVPLYRATPSPAPAVTEAISHLRAAIRRAYCSGIEKSGQIDLDVEDAIDGITAALAARQQEEE